MGQTLTASAEPAEATASYQWKQADTASGNYTDIAGASARSYKITAKEAGKFLKVEAAGTGEYTGTVTSAATEAVKTLVTKAAISGTAQVGQTLTASPTPSAATVTYEWQKADSADGTYIPIAKATGKTYVLTEAENGKFIKVKLTGTGNYTGTATSDATEAVTPAE